MTLPEYEYRGLMAQAWDILRGDTSQWEDRFYYLEMIRRSGQPALDVGCGTGRLLLDYLAQGIDIDGVDNSPEMLALCLQKARRLGLSPHVYAQYVETLDLPRRYCTILIPSSTLQLIIDPGLAEQALKRIFDHLEPGGIVTASVMSLWKEGEPFESEWEKSAALPENGASVRRIARSRYDPHSQLEHTEDIYQIIVNGQVTAEETHRRSPATRAYTQAQARALFEHAGFSNIQLRHEFSFAPTGPEDGVFTVTGQRPD
jgi:SAM-dependent methyltransferase